MQRRSRPRRRVSRRCAAQPDEVTEATDEYVRENPWAAIGIAAAVGIVHRVHRRASLIRRPQGGSVRWRSLIAPLVPVILRHLEAYAEVAGEDARDAAAAVARRLLALLLAAAARSSRC